MDKKQARIRRGRRARAKIRELGAHRLTVHRTSQHIYAQIIAPNGEQVLTSASTLDKAVKGEITGSTGNSAAASIVGKHIGQRAKEAGIERVAFDRSGFRYHGRVKALAEAAREVGLQF
ncbi:MAG: 50S ribosomal protein L18 [Pseudomonadota bacterium]